MRSFARFFLITRFLESVSVSDKFFLIAQSIPSVPTPKAFVILSAPSVGNLSENLLPGMGHLPILLDAVIVVPFSIFHLKIWPFR